jgi:hypothetical protein
VGGAKKVTGSELLVPTPTNQQSVTSNQQPVTVLQEPYHREPFAADVSEGKNQANRTITSMKSKEYGDAKVEAASSRFEECGNARVEATRCCF